MACIHAVHLSESAFMHLCLAGLESYLTREEPLETYGLLWGNVVETEDGDNEYREPLMHMAPVARVCHQMLRLRLGRGNG